MTDTAIAVPDSLAPPNVSTADPVGTVHAVVELCARLGLADVLWSSRRLLGRSEALAAASRQARGEAEQRRAKVLQELLADDQPVDTEAVAAVMRETAPWCDGTVGDVQVPAAVFTLMQASRAARSHAVQMVTAEAPDLYRQVQGVAADAVATTASLPKLPAKALQAPRPGDEVVRVLGGEVWGELVRCADRFELCHQLGGMLRRTGGLGASALLPGGAPDFGYAYRRWDLVLEPAAHNQLRRLPPSLRLRYAIDQGWEPGLWLAADLERRKVEPVRRGPIGWIYSPGRGAKGA